MEYQGSLKVTLFWRLNYRFSDLLITFMIAI